MVTLASIFALVILFITTVATLLWIDRNRLGCFAEFLTLLVGGVAMVACLFFAVAINL